MKKYLFYVLFFFFVAPQFAAQYEMDMLDYLKSKYLGRRISCGDSKYKNYKHRGYVKNVFVADDIYYVRLKNNVVCKFVFFTHGLNRTDLNRSTRSNKQGQQAVMDNQKFINSMLQTVGSETSSLPNPGGSFNINQAEMQSVEKNDWTSKSEIHYTELNSMTNKKDKVRITTEGIYIDYYKIGIAFEREISKEKD